MDPILSDLINRLDDSTAILYHTYLGISIAVESRSERVSGVTLEAWRDNVIEQRNNITGVIKILRRYAEIVNCKSEK